MKYTAKKLSKSIIEITIELPPEEMRPYLQKAATQLCTQTTIPGFRPGKAPYEDVVRHFGAGRIWEEAAQIVVPKIYSEIVVKEKLNTIGSPTIEVDKLAPDNPFIFKATAPIMPEITLGNYSAIKIETKKIDVPDKEVEKATDDLRKMRTKEVVVDRPANPTGDKVVLDMQMSLDNVPLDGGSAKDHSVYLDEDYYIPGLKQQLHGVKKGDAKTFRLAFPKEHPQKMIAGKDVDFQITIKDVYELQKPELDDAFAKALGQDNVESLTRLIRGNIQQEAEAKEKQRQEIELLEKVIEKTKFGNVPDILINEETRKMASELEQGIRQQGMDFNEYLNKIEKTRDQLRLDFAAEALKRVKIALAVGKIAAEQNITVSNEEVEEEVGRVLELYKNTPEQQERIKSENAREYLRGMLSNKKTIAWLKKQVGII